MATQQYTPFSAKELVFDGLTVPSIIIHPSPDEYTRVVLIGYVDYFAKMSVLLVDGKIIISGGDPSWKPFKSPSTIQTQKMIIQSGPVYGQVIGDNQTIHMIFSGTSGPEILPTKPLEVVVFLPLKTPISAKNLKTNLVCGSIHGNVTFSERFSGEAQFADVADGSFHLTEGAGHIMLITVNGNLSVTTEPACAVDVVVRKGKLGDVEITHKGFGDIVLSPSLQSATIEAYPAIDGKVFLQEAPKNPPNISGDVSRIYLPSD